MKKNCSSNHIITLPGLWLLCLLFLGCEKALDLKGPKTNHSAIFEEAWKLMDERYALFSVKGIDWNEMHTRFRSQVNDEMTDQAFFSVLSNMLDSLKDGHVSLISKSDTFTYDGFYKNFPANFNYNNILNNYLHNEYETKGSLIYKIVDSVGYIFYDSFDHELSDQQLDETMNAMDSTKGLMIDIRNNTGGNSANVDRFFSRFINERKLVRYELIKKGTGHNDFFDPQPHYVSPASSFYNKPVVVLTNRSCFSSCNDFVSYMAALPNVKLFGDKTGGGGSVPQDYLLANGWVLQYSATSTLSPDRITLENGISPYQPIYITPIEESNGQDPLIDQAFLYLQ